jgi:putative acetyltransferase
MHMRIATPQDTEAIRGVHASAFPEDERDIVAQLAADLLSENTTPMIFSWVAEQGGLVVGHVAFSPLTCDGTPEVVGYLLAPLAVRPEFQKQSVGSRLIRHGVEQLSGLGIGMVLVYGDPKYYGRFGFKAELAEDYVAPYPLRYPFGWQGLLLHSGLKKRAPIQVTCVSSLNRPALW